MGVKVKNGFFLRWTSVLRSTVQGGGASSDSPRAKWAFGPGKLVRKRAINEPEKANDLLLDRIPCSGAVFASSLLLSIKTPISIGDSPLPAQCGVCLGFKETWVLSAAIQILPSQMKVCMCDLYS